MIAYQMGTSIYYSTIRDIALGEELKVWYAAPYARKIGKSVTPDGVSRGKDPSAYDISVFDDMNISPSEGSRNQNLPSYKEKHTVMKNHTE